MTESNEDEKIPVLQGEKSELVFTVLSRLARALRLNVERTTLNAIWAKGEASLAQRLVLAGKQFGLSLRSANDADARQLLDLVADGFPVVLIDPKDSCLVLSHKTGSKLEVVRCSLGVVTNASLSRRQFARSLKACRADGGMVLVAHRTLECDQLSATPLHPPGTSTQASKANPKSASRPINRFFALLRMDARDIWTVALFAFVAGILGLATPLTVESLVNVVSWGIYVQPLFLLAMILLVSLGLSATLNILQTIIVEIIQRRQLVRITSDLAFRFPRADRNDLAGKYARELTNRVFDIMTIQKASAILLLDGVSIVLTTVLGLLLLAFYHPFLLGFDIVLLISMVSLTWVLGRGGIRTAIVESKTKYRIAHWLQDVLDSPSAFQVNGGEMLAIDRANRFATDYIVARKQQFRVVLRQVVFAVGLHAVASTALLGLGGWLVIQGQLTLGQLVAAELVVTVVVGAFAKAGKSIEKFYDLMAGIDKVGVLLDIPAQPQEIFQLDREKASTLQWNDLTIQWGTERVSLPAQSIPEGSSCALMLGGRSSLVMRAFAGLVLPKGGSITVAGKDVRRLAANHGGTAIGHAAEPEIFCGTLYENITLGRSSIDQAYVNDVLRKLNLTKTVNKLENGLSSKLQTGGYPLSREDATKLMIARAIVAKPGLVLIDGSLDVLSEEDRGQVLDLLMSEPNWTVVIATGMNSTAERCDTIIREEAP